MKLAVQELLTQHAADTQQAVEYAAFILANINSSIVAVTVGLDHHLGSLVRSENKQIEGALVERITHQSWKKYFNHIGLHDILGAEYFNVVKPYLFENLSESSHHYGVKQLADFNAENIAAFEAQHLGVNKSELLQAIALFLTDCGLAYRPKKFKNKLVITSMGSNPRFSPDSRKMELIGKLVKAVAHLQGDTKNTAIGDVKKALYGNPHFGVNVELYKGIGYFLHQDSSASLTFSDEVVELLNSKLPETV